MNEAGRIDTPERRTIRKLKWRLVPLLIVSYFIAYLDRVNMAFAGPGMIRDLSFTLTIFGTGAGIFFIGYVLFEVPSNLALAYYGSRRWIARIMVSWGLVSAATAFVWNDISFYIVRILLGIAEAGFFPGIIFYLSLWFPAEQRARIISWFMFAIPVSIIIGAPVSGLILELDGTGGLKGWQWLFLLEAAPALVLGGIVYGYLPDRPEDAPWLQYDEQRWLITRLAAENRDREAEPGTMQVLLDRRVLLLGLAYIGILIPGYGIGFFLPQIIATFGGLSPFEIGLVNAVPYVVGAVSMLLWARHSDVTRERKWHIAIPAALMAAGFCAAALADGLVFKITAISLAAFGFSIAPVFWTLPATLLRGAAIGAGVAAINSLGNLGGYFGPQFFGLVTDLTSSDRAGLLFLAASGVLACGLILHLGRGGTFEQPTNRPPP